MLYGAYQAQQPTPYTSHLIWFLYQCFFRVPRSNRRRWSLLLDSLPWGAWHWHFIATEETRHIAVLSSMGVTLLCVSCHVSSPPLLLWSVPSATCTTHHSSALLCTSNYAPFRVYSVWTIPFCKSLTGLLIFTTHPITTQSLYIFLFIYPSKSINQSHDQSIKQCIRWEFSKSIHPSTQFWHFWTSLPLKMKALLSFETSGITYTVMHHTL